MKISFIEGITSWKERSEALLLIMVTTSLISSSLGMWIFKAEEVPAVASSSLAVVSRMVQGAPEREPMSSSREPRKSTSKMLPPWLRRISFSGPERMFLDLLMIVYLLICMIWIRITQQPST